MSFDQAGASLVEEDDQKKLEEMGDYDENNDVRSIEFPCQSTQLIRISISGGQHQF